MEGYIKRIEKNLFDLCVIHVVASFLDCIDGERKKERMCVPPKEVKTIITEQ